MHHDLKIWPIHFSRIVDGTKTFEIRENDRYFQPDDTVTLHEWDPSPAQAAEGKGRSSTPRGYTGEEVGPFRIGVVYPIKGTNEVVFSLLPGHQSSPKKRKS